MDDLIRDAGKLRRCPSNIAKLGFWKTLYHFGSYKEVVLDIVDAIVELKEAAATLLSIALGVALFPIIPPLRCWAEWRAAVREVGEETKRRVDNLHQ